MEKRHPRTSLPDVTRNTRTTNKHPRDRGNFNTEQSQLPVVLHAVTMETAQCCNAYCIFTRVVYSLYSMTIKLLHSLKCMIEKYMTLILLRTNHLPVSRASRTHARARCLKTRSLVSLQLEMFVHNYL